MVKGRELFTKFGPGRQELLLQPLFQYLWNSLLSSLLGLLWCLLRKVVLLGKEGVGVVSREGRGVLMMMGLLSPWLRFRQSSSISSCCWLKVPPSPIFLHLLGGSRK